MIDAHGNNLVFLLCVPRSGSSLATVMLQNHSKIFATQEMWFLMSMYDLKFNQPRPYGGTGIINQFFNAIVPGQTFEQACRSFSLDIYNGLLRSGEAEMVVDKSPRYYYLLEFIDKLFPESRRIGLIRNPLSIIASYKKVNAGAGDRFNLAEDLLNPRFNMKMTDITVGLLRYYNYFAADNAKAYRLVYEKLVTEPKEELKRLTDFLGVTYEEGQEKYGNPANSSKSDMFYSMGVGDPFLAEHSEAHLHSVHSWKEILNKEEVETYCSILGARIFRELGYGEQLEEAEKWTGVKFGSEPNEELIQLRTKQLLEATGCDWEQNYRMKSEDENVLITKPAVNNADPYHANDSNPQVLQLQIALRSLEKRLENSYAEQKRLRNKLDKISSKVERLKSIIPFGNQLANWASGVLVQRGGKR